MRRDELEEALLNPNEGMSFEYKTWLDLSTNHGKATLAKAVIALANADGGYIVIGYDEEGNSLNSVPKPEAIREVTQDLINSAVQRFAAPALHLRMEIIENTFTGVRHPVVVVPSTATTPVMAVRNCEGVLQQTKVYVRKSGPRSEEPRTVEEWRNLLDRCVQRSRASMLDAIRAIVEGRVEETEAPRDLQERLPQFMHSSRTRLEQYLNDASVPADAPSRMPLGRIEIGFSLNGVRPSPNLTILRERIENAHRVKLTGWPTFLTMTRDGIAPYVSDGGIEAWIGRPDVDRYFEDDPAHVDFWRITPDGLLFTTTGYDEDGIPERVEAGTAFDLTLPIWRVGEALLFARRLAQEFEDADTISVTVRWSGLEGRALRTLSGTRGSMSRNRVSRTNELEVTRTVSLSQIDDNLPEALHALVASVYEIFGFYELPLQIVEQELERLMRRS